MSKFTIIGDERRRPTTPARRGTRAVRPLSAALLAGATVLVPAGLHALPYGTLRRHGLKLRVRFDDDGTVLWAEPVQPT